MVDRFREPACPPLTLEVQENVNFALYQQRKLAEAMAERENQEKLAKAAEKAKSGDRKDLQEWLRLRRMLL